MTPEHRRLAEANAAEAPWRKWGPYLSERQWGTVREDYSASGDVWNDFPHEQARSRAYRWGEDGLAGISDDRQLLCFALALWNGADPILKERLFGLTNGEGNHGEDVKEYYFYLDSTPTHSYMKYLYKYPQAAYPYDDLVYTNRQRSRYEAEYELIETGVFSENRYFDIVVEYAKAAPEDILIIITVHNRAATAATLDLLPTLWFRNTWSWAEGSPQPNLSRALGPGSVSVITAIHLELGDYYLYCDRTVPLLFTSNETNRQKLFGEPDRTPYRKDGINEFIVRGRNDAINPAMSGTKAAAHYRLVLPAQGSQSIRLRLTNLSPSALRSGGNRGGVKPFAVTFEQTLAARREEADAFYDTVIPAHVDDDQRRVMRQALAGLLWSKQAYLFDVETWLCEHGVDALSGPGSPHVRNRPWFMLDAHDVLSMPDKWEYPWFAAWDLAFHVVPFAMIDPTFAKQQLSLLTGSRYLNPNGQIPAHEWNFSDVSPPLHAWATHFVYHADRQLNGGIGDEGFYARSFAALMANFTWWLNRWDPDGTKLFEDCSFDLDNVGIFDRSASPPAAGTIEPSAGTAWTAFYCTSMLRIAIDLARVDAGYGDFADAFLKCFLRTALRMESIGRHSHQLWDDGDGFFYDVLRLPDGTAVRPKVRSATGLLPLCAVVVYSASPPSHPLSTLTLKARAFLDRHPSLAASIAVPDQPGVHGRLMLAAVSEDRLRRILAPMLDENEFLSDYGIRSLSRRHRDGPCTVSVGPDVLRIEYEPADSSTGLAGGNANWRGPVWLPTNLMIIDALLRYYTYYGDAFVVEYPTGSGRQMTLFAIAQDIAARIDRIFLPDEATGRRPVNGGYELFSADPHWRDLVPFYEYFHGDNGAGLGASHQTGWTGAIAKLMQFFATTTAADVLDNGLGLIGGPSILAAAALVVT